MNWFLNPTRWDCCNCLFFLFWPKQRYHRHCPISLDQTFFFFSWFTYGGLSVFSFHNSICGIEKYTALLSCNSSIGESNNREMDCEKTIGGTSFYTTISGLCGRLKLLDSHPLRLCTACPLFHVDLFVLTIQLCGPFSLCLPCVRVFTGSVGFFLYPTDISSVCTFCCMVEKWNPFDSLWQKVLGYLSSTNPFY